MSSLATLVADFVHDSARHLRSVGRGDRDALWAALTVGVATTAAAAIAIKAARFVLVGPVRAAVHWALTSGERKRIAAGLCAERDAGLAEFCAWANSDADGCRSPSAAERAELSGLGIAELQRRMRERGGGGLTAVLLLKVCVLNTADAHKRTNCVSAMVGPVAARVAEARAADARFADAGVAWAEVVSDAPLLGIPMSLKENLHVAGTYSTAGCLAFAAEGKKIEDGAVAAMLRRSGAVIFVKTNVPQTMLSYDCRNNLYGDTANPYNLAMSPGGSSGGEAALVASRGSVAGVGTDIGGSIRIPSHFCGLFSLKPSLWRAPSRGSTTPTPGQEFISSSAGPMGKSVDDLVAVFSALVRPEAAAVDGTINCVPFRRQVFDEFASVKPRLRIGYYVDDGWIRCSPACRRAVLETVAAMRAGGHDVVEFVPPNTVTVMQLFFRLIGADGFDTVASRFDGFEPPNAATLAPWLNSRVLPAWLMNWALPALVRPRSRLLADALALVRRVTVQEVYALLAGRNDARSVFARAIAEFDCVVAPGFVIPAPCIGASADKPWAISYTATYNVLDLPVVTLPITTVRPGVDDWAGGNNNGARSGQSAASGGDAMESLTRGIYSADAMAGLPVGVQVITARSSEERALGCAKRISEVMGLVCPCPAAVPH